MTTVSVSTTESLRGSVKAPPSKAWTHRALICGLLSNGDSTIRNPLQCDDTIATKSACEAFGARIEQKGSDCHVKGVKTLRPPTRDIDCRDSAATLRFFLPIAALCNGTSRFRMSPSLARRPIKPVLAVLEQLGAKVNNNDDSSIEIHARRFTGGSVRLPGNISSQFVSGFLLAAPRANGGSITIDVESPLESQPYVRLTLQALARHGVELSHSSDLRHFSVPGSQEFRAAVHEIPGDYSSVSFLVAASCATRSGIQIDELPEDPLQADSGIFKAAEEMGAAVGRNGSSINIQWPNPVRPIELDAHHSPDIVPALAAMACVANGDSRITGVHRLRVKESDRIESIVSEFAKLGGQVVAKDGEMMVTGPAMLRGADVNSRGDHRIAMALAVAALAARGTTRILGAECVSKSYPSFFEHLQRLGARVEF